MKNPTSYDFVAFFMSKEPLSLAVVYPTNDGSLVVAVNVGDGVELVVVNDFAVP